MWPKIRRGLTSFGDLQVCVVVQWAFGGERVSESCALFFFTDRVSDLKRNLFNYDLFTCYDYAERERGEKINILREKLYI